MARDGGGSNLGVKQGNFSGGELSPSLWGKTDNPRYTQGLRRCKNFIITPHGAAVSRPGTVKVAETKLSGGSTGKLVPFIYSGNNSLMLEFGNLYVRFYQKGAQVLNGGAPLEVTTPYLAADLAQLKFAQSGDVLTIVHPNYAPRELARLSALVWTLALVPFSPAVLGTVKPIFYQYSWAGSSAAAWSAVPTYASANYVSNGTGYLFMSLADGNHNNALPGVGLSNAWWTPAADTSHPLKQWSWLSTTVYRDALGAVRETPAGVQIANGTVAADGNVLTETIALFSDRPAALQFADAWGTPPAGATKLGNNIYRGRNGLYGFIGSLPVGQTYFVDDGSLPDYTQGPPLGTTPFQNAAAPSLWSRLTAYNIGDQVLWSGTVHTALGSLAAGLLAPSDDGINWAASTYAPANTYAAGAWVNYGDNVYLSLAGANTGNTPSISPTWWTPVDLWPATVAYFEQRRVFGGSGALSHGIAGSASGSLYNFDRSGAYVNPAQPTNLTKATDSVLFRLAATKREEIRSLVPLRSLLLLTSVAERSLRGAGGSALTNQSFDEKKHSDRGSSWLSPLVIGNIILFLTQQGSRVRDLLYNFYADSYAGKDVSLHAEHLLRGHTIVAWTYQTLPYAVAWAVRDDGVLLAITYQDAPATDFESDDKIDAWHQHATQGFFEDTCSIPEGGEDAVYFIVRRVIMGTTHRFVERMATRVLTDQRTFVASDCSLTFDGRNSNPTALVTLQGGVYTAGTICTLLASAHAFATVLPGNQVVLDPDGTSVAVDAFDALSPQNIPWDAATNYGANSVVQFMGAVYFSLQANNINIRPGTANAATWWAPANGPFACTVQSVTDSAHVQVLIEAPIPPALQGIGTTSWGLATSSFTVAHLAGQSVAVVADGTPRQYTLDAAGGLVLSAPAVIVIVGLAYSLQLETLDLTSPEREVRSNQKTIARAGLELELSAPFSIQLGPTFGNPPNFAEFDATKFVPFQQRDVHDPVGVAPALFTGFDQQNLKGTWSPYGRVALLCTDPVPVTVMNITRDATIGGSVS
jgi:hypothetical protein